jgi:hypothetical protein
MIMDQRWNDTESTVREAITLLRTPEETRLLHLIHDPYVFRELFIRQVSPMITVQIFLHW